MSTESDERPAIVIVPTELERQDARRDLGLLFFSLLYIGNAVTNQGMPLALAAVLFAPVALFVLTGEPAADVGWVGDIAAGLRGRLGQRRAHEWLLAATHFFILAIWPVLCLKFSNSVLQPTSRWLAPRSERIRCSLSRVYCRASSIRPRWSASRAK